MTALPRPTALPTPLTSTATSTPSGTATATASGNTAALEQTLSAPTPTPPASPKEKAERKAFWERFVEKVQSEQPFQVALQQAGKSLSTFEGEGNFAEELSNAINTGIDSILALKDRKREQEIQDKELEQRSKESEANIRASDATATSAVTRAEEAKARTEIAKQQLELAKTSNENQKIVNQAELALRQAQKAEVDFRLQELKQNPPGANLSAFADKIQTAASVLQNANPELTPEEAELEALNLIEKAKEPGDRTALLKDLTKLLAQNSNLALDVENTEQLSTVANKLADIPFDGEDSNQDRNGNPASAAATAPVTAASFVGRSIPVAEGGQAKILNISQDGRTFQVEVNIDGQKQIKNVPVDKVLGSP